MRIEVLKLQNRVMQNDVTLRVALTQALRVKLTLFIEILLSSH